MNSDIAIGDENLISRRTAKKADTSPKRTHTNIDLPTRVNLKLSDRLAERLESLREITDAATCTEVVRNALKLYDFLVTIEREGKSVCIQDSSGELVRMKTHF